MSNVIRSMLQVNPHMRPSPEKLLKLPCVINRMDTQVAENVIYKNIVRKKLLLICCCRPLGFLKKSTT